MASEVWARSAVRARRYRAQAKRLRRLAEIEKDSSFRRQLLDLVSEYREVAERIEAGGNDLAPHADQSEERSDQPSAPQVVGD